MATIRVGLFVKSLYSRFGFLQDGINHTQNRFLSYKNQGEKSVAIRDKLWMVDDIREFETYPGLEWV